MDGPVVVVHFAAITLFWDTPFRFLAWPVDTKPYPPARIADLDPAVPPLPDPLKLPPVDPPPPEEIPDPPEPEIEEPPDPVETFQQLPPDGDIEGARDRDDLPIDEPWTGPHVHVEVRLTGTTLARRTRDRDDHVRREGGTVLTEHAVVEGLAWLARHQDADGRWNADDFMRHDPADDRCDGAGRAPYDVGLTGLALVAFQGAGHASHGSSAVYRRHVRRGLAYLVDAQDEDGTVGPRSTRKFMFNHAIATYALCDAYRLTRVPSLRRPARRALDFVAMARNPYKARRYEPRGGENDTAITAWCVQALAAGRFAGLGVDPGAFEGARQWIEKMTDPHYGQVGYNMPGGPQARYHGRSKKFPWEKSQSMSAAGMLCRMLLGEDPRASDPIRKGVQLCLEVAPTWNPDDGSIDMYYWSTARRRSSGWADPHGAPGTRP